MDPKRAIPISMHLLFLVSFVDLQMHIVIIFVLITSVVVYFCSRLPADLKYLDVLKTRIHSFSVIS